MEFLNDVNVTMFEEGGRRYHYPFADLYGERGVSSLSEYHRPEGHLRGIVLGGQRAH